MSSERREFRLPDLGEGLTEAEIVTWHVSPGDTVRLNQTLAEVETEKAVVELPSPFAGTVVELLAAAGDTVEVGRPIIALDVEGTEPSEPVETSDEKVQVLVGYGPGEAPASRRHRRRRNGSADAPAPPTSVPTRPLAKPPVRYMARVRGVDLDQVTGTGPGGVITREDVLAHADIPNEDASVTLAGWGRETRTPVKGIQQHMADAMVRSAFSAPHVTEFVTVDVTPSMELVEQLQGLPVFEGCRVSILTLVVRAMLLALENSPALNSSWDEEQREIVTKHYVNLGVAVATERGLVVPNIKDAQALKMRDLARALTTLTDTARAGRATPADMREGTITVTNIGVFGVDGGTPIINPGEAAILCTGAIRRQPWEHQGDIALRQVMTLSLSFDHRLVDGQQGSEFLAAVAGMVADPTLLLALS